MQIKDETIYIKCMLKVELNNLIKKTIWEIHDIIKINNNYNSFDILTIVNKEINLIMPFLFIEIDNLKSNNEYYLNVVKKLWIDRLDLFKQQFLFSNDTIKSIEKFEIKKGNFDDIFKEFPFKDFIDNF